MCISTACARLSHLAPRRGGQAWQSSARVSLPTLSADAARVRPPVRQRQRSWPLLLRRGAIHRCAHESGSSALAHDRSTRRQAALRSTSLASAALRRDARLPCRRIRTSRLRSSSSGCVHRFAMALPAALREHRTIPFASNHATDPAQDVVGSTTDAELMDALAVHGCLRARPVIDRSAGAFGPAQGIIECVWRLLADLRARRAARVPLSAS